MTDARNAGVVREALVAPYYYVDLSGVVREVLVSGYGLAGRAKGHSAGRAMVSVVTGIPLSGTAAAISRARASAIQVIAVAGRIGARARLGLVQLPDGLPLYARVYAQSRAGLVDRSVRVIQAQGRAASRARGTLTLRLRGPQNAVTLNV